MKQTFSIAEFIADQFDRLLRRERSESRRLQRPCASCSTRTCAGRRRFCLPCAAGFTLATPRAAG